MTGPDDQARSRELKVMTKEVAMNKAININAVKLFLGVLLFALSSLLPWDWAQSNACAVEESAVYKLTFDSVWSAQTHPTSFPPGPHFSGLVGGTHNNSIAFWEVGSLASTGIENMAEAGSKTALIAEVNAAINGGNAGEVISGPGLSPSPGSAQVTFSVTKDFPLATVVTMIAPSPDWFVGVSGVELFNGQVWEDEVVVSLQPFDAGTDSGVNYTSGNVNTVPAEMIFEITGFPFDVGGTVPPLGTFTFTRVFEPTFVSDTETISASTGGSVNFSLDADRDHRLRPYVILGSVTGTSPGFPLPGGTTTLCLNWDVLTETVVNRLNTPVFQNFLGSLDASSQAAAQMNAPPLDSSLVGIKLYFAFCLIDPFDFASNPREIEIVP
jgi:hypothetical protein